MYSPSFCRKNRNIWPRTALSHAARSDASTAFFAPVLQPVGGLRDCAGGQSPTERRCRLRDARPGKRSVDLSGAAGNPGRRCACAGKRRGHRLPSGWKKSDQCGLCQAKSDHAPGAGILYGDSGCGCGPHKNVAISRSALAGCKNPGVALSSCGGGTDRALRRHFPPAPFSVAAAATSFLKAAVSSGSPSWMSMARCVAFQAGVKKPEGSLNDAPRDASEWRDVNIC